MNVQFGAVSLLKPVFDNKDGSLRNKKLELKISKEGSLGQETTDIVAFLTGEEYDEYERLFGEIGQARIKTVEDGPYEHTALNGDTFTRYGKHEVWSDSKEAPQKQAALGAFYAECMAKIQWPEDLKGATVTGTPSRLEPSFKYEIPS